MHYTTEKIARKQVLCVDKNVRKPNVCALLINVTIRMHTFGNLKMYKIDSAVIMILR